jgi:2'-5' RNA ligase
MPFAVQLFFDGETDTAIRRIWRELAEDNVAPYLHASANRPHLTLGIYEELELAESSAALGAFAAEEPSFPFAMRHIGSFPPTNEAVVFCAPVVTQRLIALHARIHALLGGIAAGPDERYLPGNWIPHCSLATHCPAERALDAVAVCLRLFSPIEGSVVAIGVIQTGPARPQFSHTLHPMIS